MLIVKEFSNNKQILDKYENKILCLPNHVKIKKVYRLYC